MAGCPEKEISAVTYHEVKHYHDHQLGVEPTESRASSFERKMVAYSRPEMRDWQPVVVVRQQPTTTHMGANF